jgi:hypothetical protein
MLRIISLALPRPAYSRTSGDDRADREQNQGIRGYRERQNCGTRSHHAALEGGD